MARMFLTGRLRPFRLWEILTVPGEPLTGFLLAGGLLSVQYGNLAVLCCAAAFAHLFGSVVKDFFGDHLIPRRHVPVWSWSSLLLCIACASVNGRSAVCIAGLVFCGYLRDGLLFDRRIPFCILNGICRIFAVLSGAVLCDPFAGTRMIGPLIYSVGMGLYFLGVSLAETDPSAVLKKRAGSMFVLSGSLICYLTVFGFMSLVQARNLFPILCGIFAALSGAFFVSLAWCGFRVIRAGVPVSEMKLWVAWLSMGILLIQASVCAGKGAVLSAFVLTALLYPSFRLWKYVNREVSDE